MIPPIARQKKRRIPFQPSAFDEEPSTSIPESLITLGIPENHTNFLANLPDSKYQQLLRMFADNDPQYRHFLVSMLVHESYRRWHKTCTIQFVEPLEEFKWPEQVENLENSMMTLRRPEDPTNQANLISEAKERPLFLGIKRRWTESKKSDKKLKKPAEFYNIQDPKFDDIFTEIQAPTSPFVTLDESFDLHMALRETVEKIWSSELSNFSTSHLPESLSPDRYLKMIIAEKSQTLLSNVIDFVFKFRKDANIERTLNWQTLFRLTRMADVIPPSALERTHKRMMKLFPFSIVDYNHKIPPERSKSDSLSFKKLYDSFCKKEFAKKPRGE